MAKHAALTVMDFLASRKVAIILLLFLIVLSLVGVLVPQTHLSTLPQSYYWQLENPFIAKISLTLGLDQVFTGFAFVAICSVLTVSLTVCTYNRANQYWAAKKIPLHRWGSILFHLGFVCLFAGALVSVWTRVESSFLLTEGQVLQDFKSLNESTEKKYVLGFNPPDFAIQLRKFSPPAKQGRSSARNELLLVEEGKPAVIAEVRPYHAYTYKGYTLYQKEHGYSPRLTMFDSNGNQLINAFVALKTHITFARDRIIEDEISVPGRDMIIKASFFPNTVEVGMKSSEAGEMNKNAMRLDVIYRDKTLFSGNLLQGETVHFEGYSIRFDDLRYWSSFRMVTDKGVPVVYAGFFIGIVGLFLRLFWGVKPLARYHEPGLINPSQSMKGHTCGTN